jgi:predicted DNA-binding transcriptional regulator AlpA
MSTSPSVHLADAENRDIFDSLESCEKLLTARDVARILSISEKTVYSYVSRNLIPHYKIEANVRFRARDLTDADQPAVLVQHCTLEETVQQAVILLQ